MFDQYRNDNIWTFLQRFNELGIFVFIYVILWVYVKYVVDIIFKIQYEPFGYIFSDLNQIK